MYNPLLSDLSKVKNEDLEIKINEIMKNHAIAARSGQGQICYQFEVLLEAYRSEQQRRYFETSKKGLKDKNFEDLINIDS